MFRFRKIKRYLKDPYYSFGNLLIDKFPRLMTDKFYLSVQWKRLEGYNLDWNNPKTFREKLQWLKVYDRKPVYTTMADKYRAKKWIADRIDEQYIIPTLAVYGSVEEIDLDMLPNQFVLKCNHDCGSVVICRDKSTFNIEAAKQKLKKGLGVNYYWYSREWVYKNVRRCVFAEQYIFDDRKEETHELHDYKFYCFNGEPKLFYITSNRGAASGLCEDFYDINGNHLDLRQEGADNANPHPSLPLNLDLMVTLARKLSQDTYQLRVDFYEVNGKVYVGELSFYDGAGLCRFNENKYDYMLGDWIKLPMPAKQ